jgi:hypothetical protein
MKQHLNIRGSQTTVPEIEVNVDTVYIRTNIMRVDTEDFTGWQYDEVQYGKNEYISMLAKEEQINALKQENEGLLSQLAEAKVTMDQMSAENQNFMDYYFSITPHIVLKGGE